MEVNKVRIHFIPLSSTRLQFELVKVKITTTIDNPYRDEIYKHLKKCNNETKICGRRFDLSVEIMVIKLVTLYNLLDIWQRSKIGYVGKQLSKRHLQIWIAGSVSSWEIDI